ncbi:hypothetical protein [Neobacillus cucumis]|uniref:hypothetical protein n=1 Tax=Neobacillus cucumis TaxID=1740721 RepID=UPI0028531395|nr:hypothetical protein [Neobacillus cucumis]MDR4946014.1 hypothetical protein [Neobacillus cucumis]
MHTLKTLKTTDFGFSINDYTASLEDVLPVFSKNDRIGIVVKTLGGSIGAGALLMAIVTRFYDFHRPNLGNKPGELRIYPEIFVFHVEKFHMNHANLDVWPPHREIVVENEPERILEAINDRGITRLLIEDAEPSTKINMFMPETISSAEQRIVSALAYSPTGRVKHSDVKVMSCEAAEGYILGTIEMSKEFSEEEKERLSRERRDIIVNGRVTESYRRITVTEAIKSLSQSTELGPTTRRYMGMSSFKY